MYGGQLQAYFPEALLVELSGYLKGLWDERGNKDTVVVDFGLSQEFMRPLRCFTRFEPDPLAGLVGAMTDLANGEVALLQILFHAGAKPLAGEVSCGRSRTVKVDRFLLTIMPCFL